ncbi:hypothetical protein Ancab_022067 [Ancistrocladus abbreviatus]
MGNPAMIGALFLIYDRDWLSKKTEEHGKADSSAITKGQVAASSASTGLDDRLLLGWMLKVQLLRAEKLVVVQTRAGKNNRERSSGSSRWMLRVKAEQICITKLLFL